MLVSVGQTTRQRISYFYGNEAISMSEHRAPTYYHTEPRASRSRGSNVSNTWFSNEVERIIQIRTNILTQRH